MEEANDNGAAVSKRKASQPLIAEDNVNSGGGKLQDENCNGAADQEEGEEVGKKPR